MADYRRIQVPIDAEAESVIGTLRDASEPVDESVRAILGDVPKSEAGIAARLLAIGARTVRQAQREAGYSALAQSMDADPDATAYETAAEKHRRRQASAWADA
jgi:hypothetical protein